MCPGAENLIKNSEQRYEDNSVDNITYRQWMTTDRSILDTTVHSSSDFLEFFAKTLS
jgi:hypothetical protein